MNSLLLIDATIPPFRILHSALGINIIWGNVVDTPKDFKFIIPNRCIVTLRVRLAGCKKCIASFLFCQSCIAVKFFAITEIEKLVIGDKREKKNDGSLSRGSMSGIWKGNFAFLQLLSWCSRLSCHFQLMFSFFPRLCWTLSKVSCSRIGSLVFLFSFEWIESCYPLGRSYEADRRCQSITNWKLSSAETKRSFFQLGKVKVCDK